MDNMRSNFMKPFYLQIIFIIIIIIIILNYIIIILIKSVDCTPKYINGEFGGQKECALFVIFFFITAERMSFVKDTHFIDMKWKHYLL